MAFHLRIKSKLLTICYRGLRELAPNFSCWTTWPPLSTSNMCTWDDLRDLAPTTFLPETLSPQICRYPTTENSTSFISLFKPPLKKRLPWPPYVKKQLSPASLYPALFVCIALTTMWLYMFDTIFLPLLKYRFCENRACVYSLLCPWLLIQCLVHSRYAICVHWINKQMNECLNPTYA